MTYLRREYYSVERPALVMYPSSETRVVRGGEASRDLSQRAVRRRSSTTPIYKTMTIRGSYLPAAAQSLRELFPPLYRYKNVLMLGMRCFGTVLYFRHDGIRLVSISGASPRTCTCWDTPLCVFSSRFGAVEARSRRTRRGVGWEPCRYRVNELI